MRKQTSEFAACGWHRRRIRGGGAANARPDACAGGERDRCVVVAVAKRFAFERAAAGRRRRRPTATSAVTRGYGHAGWLRTGAGGSSSGGRGRGRGCARARCAFAVLFHTLAFEIHALALLAQASFFLAAALLFVLHGTKQKQK